MFEPAADQADGLRRLFTPREPSVIPMACCAPAAACRGYAALLAQQRYSSGLIDFQAVLETQRTLLSTQESVATTTAAVAADHVRLYKALGGGWAVAE